MFGTHHTHVIEENRQIFKYLYISFGRNFEPITTDPRFSYLCVCQKLLSNITNNFL